MVCKKGGNCLCTSTVMAGFVIEPPALNGTISASSYSVAILHALLLNCSNQLDQLFQVPSGPACLEVAFY